MSYGVGVRVGVGVCASTIATLANAPSQNLTNALLTETNIHLLQENGNLILLE